MVGMTSLAKASLSTVLISASLLLMLPQSLQACSFDRVGGSASDPSPGGLSSSNYEDSASPDFEDPTVFQLKTVIVDLQDEEPGITRLSDGFRPGNGSSFSVAGDSLYFQHQDRKLLIFSLHDQQIHFKNEEYESTLFWLAPTARQTLFSHPEFQALLKAIHPAIARDTAGLNQALALIGAPADAGLVLSELPHWNQRDRANTTVWIKPSKSFAKNVLAGIIQVPIDIARLFVCKRTHVSSFGSWEASYVYILPYCREIPQYGFGGCFGREIIGYSYVNIPLLVLIGLSGYLAVRLRRSRGKKRTV